MGCLVGTDFRAVVAVARMGSLKMALMQVTQPREDVGVLASEVTFFAGIVVDVEKLILELGGLSIGTACVA